MIERLVEWWCCEIDWPSFVNVLNMVADYILMRS